MTALCQGSGRKHGAGSRQTSPSPSLTDCRYSDRPRDASLAVDDVPPARSRKTSANNNVSKHFKARARFQIKKVALASGYGSRYSPQFVPGPIENFRELLGKGNAVESKTRSDLHFAKDRVNGADLVAVLQVAEIR